MTPVLRPLPATIAIIALLTGVKTVDLAKSVGIGSPARASTEQTSPPQPSAASKLGQPVEKAVPAAAATPKPARDQKPAPDEACGDPVTDAERKTLQDLRIRRKQLDDRTARLDEREAVLGAAEQRLTERVQQLTALQAKLEGLDKQRKDREEENWQELVKTYEAMKPRDAAVIFNDLDKDILIQVLDRMKPAKAAPVLAAMAPERARAATLQLAKYREQLNAAPQLGAAK